MKKANNNRKSNSHSSSKKGKRSGQPRLSAAQRRAEWLKMRDNPNRYEIATLLTRFVSTRAVPRTGSVPDYVNALYRAAMLENAALLILLIAGKSVLREYFEKCPTTYDGPDLYFTPEGMEGGAAKVNLLLSLGDTMSDEFVIGKDGKTRPNTLWLGRFDAKLGGMVRSMSPKVQLAIKRGYKEQYDRVTQKTRHFDRNIVASRGISIPLVVDKGDDEDSTEFLPKWALATEGTPIQEVARENMVLLDETHRENVGCCRRAVDGFIRFTAASRREWLPYLLRFLERVNVTPDEAGVPAQWVAKARTAATKLRYSKERVFLRVVLWNIAGMRSWLDSCPTCLVAA